MKYQIFITEKAEEDLNVTADYLIYKLLAGENALKQIQRIEQAIMSLEEMPERYHRYDKEPWQNKNLRVMSVDNYLVLYTVDGDKRIVNVIRIMYAKRDIDTQLNDDNH